MLDEMWQYACVWALHCSVDENLSLSLSSDVVAVHTCPNRVEIGRLRTQQLLNCSPLNYYNTVLCLGEMQIKALFIVISECACSYTVILKDVLFVNRLGTVGLSKTFLKTFSSITSETLSIASIRCRFYSRDEVTAVTHSKTNTTA